MVIIENADTGEFVSWTTAGRRRNGGARKTSLVSKAKNAAKSWWNGLGSEKQAELIGTAITVGGPLLYAGGKYVYNKIKEWRANRKARQQGAPKPSNQVYRGVQTTNYTTGGGGIDPISYDNYGDSSSGSYGTGGESASYAYPIIL